MARLAPYYSPGSLTKLDKRTREARLMCSTRAELMAHFGGKPSATQRALIERVVVLTLHVALIDAKADAGGMTEHDSRTYLAWNNSLVRTMKALGLKGPAQQPPSLREHMAQRASA